MKRLCLLLLFVPGLLVSQEAADFFRQNCISCHTIGGGRLTGPDLKNVAQRRDRAWLGNFLVNPKAVLDSGDPYAAQLLQDSRGVVMPTIPGLTKDRASALLDLIEAESKLAKSQFVGLQISDRPFTPADIQLGKDIILGKQRLANGGPACISCHTAKGLGGLGGGRLGPDLTLVYERLQGRKNLAAWLYAPATVTMQPLFKKQALKPEEILPLVAFFEQGAKQGGQDDSVAMLNVFFLALGGTVVALVAFDAAWQHRFRTVRRSLIQAFVEKEKKA